MLFASLGIWLGLKLTRKKEVVVVKEVLVSVDQPFTLNEARLRELAVTPRELEILGLIATGLSNREIADALATADQRIRVVDNPASRTPSALNLGIAASTHKIIVRVDGHGELTDGYIKRAVELLDETGAANVGGVMDAQGTTPFEQAVATAYTTRLGLGGSAFHLAESPAAEAETVFLGVFRKDALIAVGGFDETMHRAQDWELNYRIRQAAELPGLPVTRTVIALDEFLAGKWGADNDAVQLVVAPLAADRRFRTARDPAIFTAVLRTVPACAGWLDVMDPITDVFPMGGLHNTLRRLVADGSPVATGLLAIGDSVCTTNPTLGRGLALALTGAADLADTLAEYGDDPAAHALAMDRLVAAHVAPFYQDQAAIDAARLAMMRHTIFGEPAPPPPAVADRVSYPELRVAGCYDPVAFRAFWTINGMVRPPDEVYTDPQVVACTREALGRHGSGPPVAQPTRAQLLAALAA